MSQEDEAKPVREVSDEEYQAFMENGPWADAWAEFILNGDSGALARYLRLGGDVNETVRDALIAYLEKYPRKQPGGSKKFRDLEVCAHVHSERTRDALSNLARRVAGEPSEKLRSTRKILQEFAKSTNQELRTVEKMYERGRKIFPQSQ